MHEAMCDVLRHAYQHPRAGGVFYSANGAVTASDRLNATPYWDWTPAPVVSLGHVTTASFPLALGCPPRQTSEGKLWCSPIFHGPDDVYRWSPPDMDSSHCGDIQRRYAQLVAETPPGTLVREPDIQSPLGVAELMWDESFYFALSEAPEAVHRLLDQVTDFIIAHIRALQRIAGARFVAAGFPLVWSDPHGTMVADDTMSLVSPEMHAEFSVPYVNRIAAACGPLHYHSCSWYPKHFANIHTIGPRVSANWNPGNSADPRVIMAEFGGECVLTPHVVQGMHLDKDLLKTGVPLADEVALVEFLLDSCTPETTLYFWLSNICRKGPEIERIYDLFHARGHSPQAHGLA